MICSRSSFLPSGSCGACTSGGHQINWDDAEVLDTEQTWDKRKYKEALHIAQKGRQHLMMNKDAGWRIHWLWGEFLS